jgi:prepilin-type N-terminal cleavage/methylation domain-containing protein
MRKAFTLVELLVVIAVISVLMGILVPALSDARQIAKQVVCQSNLRQLVLANIGYSTENDGFFVPAASDILTTNSHRWHGVRKDFDQDFDPSKGPLISYLSDGKVKECPCKKDFFKSDDWDSNFEKGCGGFGYNMTYIGSRLWQTGYQSESFIRTARATEIRKSSDTLMFADTAFLQGQNIIEYSFVEPRYFINDGILDTNSLPRPSIHFRHRSKTDIGWTDGHISAKSMTKVGKQKSEEINLLIGWFGPTDNTPFDLQ